MADLDLNHLIAEKNGGLTAERVPDAELIGRLRQLEGRPEAQFARGVDLAAVRDKRFRQHRWTMFATFAVDEDTVEAMYREQKDIAGYIAREEVVPERIAIPIEMDNETIIDMQGPGCIKCNVLWEAPEGGYMTMCPVDDRQWQQTLGERRAQQERERSANMDRVVAIEKAKL